MCYHQFYVGFLVDFAVGTGLKLQRERERVSRNDDFFRRFQTCLDVFERFFERFFPLLEVVFCFIVVYADKTCWWNFEKKREDGGSC